MAELSLRTARMVAPAAFVFNVGSQIYGVGFAKPSITDINSANVSFFTPDPIYIGLAFSSVMILQGWWLWKLLFADPSEPENETSLNYDFLPYIPFNIAGNLCIGIWLYFWVSSHLILADIFVLISTSAQLYYLFLSPSLAPIRAGSVPSRLTHIVIKSFTALGVLDTLHNSSIAFAKDAAPGLPVKILTGFIFALLAGGGDAIFGICLVLDLVGLCFGQIRYGQDSPSWPALLMLYAVLCAVVCGKRWIWAKFTGREYHNVQIIGNDGERTRLAV